MFGFQRTETAAVELYGKLPLAKDYLRVGCGADSGLALREWLDRAFSGAAGAEGPPALAWPMSFVTGDALGPPLCGCAWPSSDAGGLRKFPFALFVERKRKALLEDLEDGLARTASVWRKLDGFYAARANFGDGQSLLAGMRGKEIEIDALEAAPDERVDFDSWVRALWPSDQREGLTRALAQLESLKRAAYRGPLRLPIASDLPLRAQVHAWWKLCVAVELLEQGALPTLFAPSGAIDAQEPAFVVFLRGALAPADAAWLVSAREVAARAEGDLCDGAAAHANAPSPAAENAPSLADSLRGAWIGVRGRASRP
jgi:hypothetical protein